MNGSRGGRRARIAVIGFPNVGKSTLINRLAGGREAVVHHEAGVTRDRKVLPCEWNGVKFELIDTGGVDLADEDSLARAVQAQAKTAIAEADAVAFVLDARAGVRQGDAELAQILRAAGKPIVLVANKVDRPRDEHLTAELHGLGLGDPLPVSAAHGHGTGDLLDRLAGLAAEVEEDEPAAGGEDVVRVAVIGRPNAGKSSLVNAFAGAERVIVSERAGTTRDAIDTEIEVDGRQVVLIDTAGLRRRSKLAESIDFYAQLRSERAAERADVAIVVCDATEGITSADLRVTELAMKKGCATIVALNKWDIAEADLDDARARLERRVRMRPELVATSALTGRAVEKLLPKALELADRRARRIPTPELNRIVGAVVADHAPPARRGGRRLRLYYSAQVGRRPPRFAIKVNDRRLIDRDWAYFLENRLRAAGGFEGVPLIIDFVPKDRERRARSGTTAAASP